jgi:hypothetical protein
LPQSNRLLLFIAGLRLDYLARLGCLCGLGALWLIRGLLSSKKRVGAIISGCLALHLL